MLIVKDTNDEYHSKNSISASGLKKIHSSSVYHFINEKFKETPAMALGTAVHQAILEPDDFWDLYHVTQKIDKRTKAGKEAYQKEIELADGKIILDQDTYDIIKNIKQNFKKNDLAVKYTKGEKELSHYKKHDGIDVRIRPDVVNNIGNYISDVKTCQRNTPKQFRSDVIKYSYHIQAAFYMDMLDIDNFKFLCVETNHPYTTVVHTLDDEFIQEGRVLYKRALDQWKKYVKDGNITLYVGEQCDDGSYLITRKWKN